MLLFSKTMFYASGGVSAMSCAAAPQELGVFSVRISFFLFFFLPMFKIYVSSGAPKGYVLLFAVTVEGAPVSWTGILSSCLCQRGLMVMEILTCVSRSPGPTASGCSGSGYGSFIPSLQWLWRKEMEFLEGASNWFLL